MRIKSVTLEPLRDKHYSTDLVVEVCDEWGFPNSLVITISGYYPKPSQRELDKGWEPDYGMDHVETHAEHVLALIIKQALEVWK